MSNSGGFAVTRTHGSDRFYNPPAVRRNQQLVLQQQQQLLQRPLKSPARVDPVEAETRTNSDESSLSRPNSISSSSPPRTANLTNLDRLMESVTPLVPVQFLSEPKKRGWRTTEADGSLYFLLGDLWESFREWSAYGVEVPLLLNGSDSVKQYYIPYLSGIQLYVEPHRPRRPGEDSDAESSRETSSAGSSDCETEKRGRGSVDGAWMQHNLMNVNSQRLSRLSLRDRPPLSSSSDETEVCNYPGQLVFEYFEREQPHFRPPVYDKVTSLASHFPELKKYRSCDLLPSSWFSVAWYPIYRIPVGSTLRSLDASFLTFHSLSTLSRSKFQPQFNASGAKKIRGVNAKVSLPVFALASCKLRGSIFTPDGGSEWQQANSLLQAADDWLQRLQVHPNARQLMTRPVPYFKDLCVIYDPTFDGKESPRQDLDQRNSVEDERMEASETGLSPAVSNYIEEDGNNVVWELAHTSEKHKRQLEVDSTCPKRLRDDEQGIASTLQEMGTRVSSLSTKKGDGNEVPIEIVIEAIQSLPGMDEDLVLDACDSLEDEKKARTFLALDVQLRKNGCLGNFVSSGPIPFHLFFQALDS